MKFYEALRKMDLQEKFCICDNNPNVVFCVRNNILYCCVSGSYWQPNDLLNSTWFMSNMWRVIKFASKVQGFPEPPLNNSFRDYNI